MARPTTAKFIKWSDPPQRSALFNSKREKKQKPVAKPTGWQKIKMKLETKPGEWALIKVTDKRPVLTKKSGAHKLGIQLVTRQFEYKPGIIKYGTWAMIPVEGTTVKNTQSDLTDTPNSGNLEK